MASNDEGQGSGDCDDVYRVADEFLSLADDQPMLLLGPPVASGTETDTQTGAETETGAEIQTGIVTGAETGAASGSGAGVEPKAKRQRVPNKLRTTRLVVTEVDNGNFEPKAPEEARACYGNQIGCIIRTTATINDENLKKIENMRSSLLKKFHQIFLFPGRNEKDYKDPDEDPAMKKINKHAMTKFSDALAAWKNRVKARIIDKKEPYSEIVKDNPTITEEQFQIFKEACEAEAAKKKSKYMKGLQKRNIGSHHLGSRGYGGKRSKWAKEDAEAASLGIPDPLADFTVPQERDVLRARHRWDPVKKVYETTPVITEFMRLLVILVSDQFDCTR